MTLHTKLSYLKSLLRIFGYCLLVFNIVLATIILIVSEVVGIVEELPGSYKGTIINTPTVKKARIGKTYIRPVPIVECDCFDCMEPTLRYTGFDDPPGLR